MRKVPKRLLAVFMLLAAPACDVEQPEDEAIQGEENVSPLDADAPESPTDEDENEDEDGKSSGGDADEDVGPACGNGIVEADEACDDGRESAACNADCTLAVCGDGVVNMTANEQCDDAGQSDNCDADCTLAKCGDGRLNLEAGEVCDHDGESALCNDDCTPAYCGDGKINATAGEACDDGDESESCNADCTPAACGDGVVNAAAGEECDDGGESALCNDDCTLAVCGDAVVNQAAGEMCDTGGPSEACNDDCTTYSCGNGLTEPANDEACDDAGESALCNIDCSVAACGDGIVNVSAGEACDDSGESASCDEDCTVAECGDGVLNPLAGEACDDGNDEDDDGCANDCTSNVATCDLLLTDASVWGVSSKGIDLRSWTDGSLDWIGCPGNGCEPDTFYCEYDPITQTLQFGTTSDEALRALVDPGNVAGDAFPTEMDTCASALNPRQVVNAPLAHNNGVEIDGGGSMVDALCKALGYSSGTMLRSSDDNYCPEAHVLDASGESWASDFAFSDGAGAEYLCSNL